MGSIAIIGYGIVGQAQHLVFDKIYVNIHDPDKDRHADWQSSDVVFLCVPTPMGNDGSCDTSTLEHYLSQPTDAVFVIRSTCPPEFLRHWESKVKLVFMPEFLTERSWRQDALNPIALVLGGHSEHTETVKDLYGKYSVFTDRDFICTDIASASLLKYTANTWFATKVTLLNYVYEYCQQTGIDYNTVALLLGADPRIGHTHLQVPGPDGSRGFGGKCFPKDLSATIKFFEAAGIDHKLLKSVNEDNRRFRND